MQSILVVDVSYMTTCADLKSFARAYVRRDVQVNIICTIRRLFFKFIRVSVSLCLMTKHVTIIVFDFGVPVGNLFFLDLFSVGSVPCL